MRNQENSRSKKYAQFKGPNSTAECTLPDAGCWHLHTEQPAFASGQLCHGIQSDGGGSKHPRYDPEGLERIDALFSRIMLFVAVHFRDEEEMMQQQGFPGYARHKKLHEKFTAKMAIVQSHINNRKVSFSAKLSNLLWDFLYVHINEEDAQYGSYYRDKGLRK